VFGVIHHMSQSFDWVVPTLAGEPFMEKPPLYYWVATGLSYLLSGWLPPHDAARLTSGFFMLITCGALGAATRSWWGIGTGRFAALCLIACLGTLEQSHLMMPDVALLSAFALSALGFTKILELPIRGGMLIGAGVGMGFLSKGLIGPGVMGITALVLPTLFAQWRTCEYRRGLAIAIAFCLPFCLIWPASLYVRSPELFTEWFWVNNIGRFTGTSVAQLGTEHLPWFWSTTIPWYTFPVLPLAILSLWKMRLTALRDIRVQYCVVAFGVLMCVLALSSSGRCVYAWPLLIPISILAAPAVCALRAKVDALWSLLAITIFGFCSLAIWAGWALMMLTSSPPDWPRLLRLLPADFVPHFRPTEAMLALAVTVGAGYAWSVLRTRPGRGLAAWAIGLTLSWSLLTTLWMPWLDYAKSYRSVFSAMPIAHQVNCIASINLGEGERAMLRYVTGYNPVRREVAPQASCTNLLIQREAAHGEPTVDRLRWKEVWRGSRPGVTNERFWLFKLEPQSLALGTASSLASSTFDPASLK
jgi:4-amino-4-deoxy-L-arabinose transferase-like glycosyltransferase